MFFLLFFVSVYYVYQLMVNKKFNIYIVQGSGIGPTAFVLTASDLCALSLLIFLNKYADDCYLIVPPDQASLISTEMAHVEKWAQDNNPMKGWLFIYRQTVLCRSINLPTVAAIQRRPPC